MYGTLSHLRPKSGQYQAVLDHLFRWEQEYLPRARGFVGGYVFEPVAGVESFGIMLIVVFESQLSYMRHRDDQEQDRWEQQMLLLLEQAPERKEGEITEITGELRGL
jgi:hypothetical protein